MVTALDNFAASMMSIAAAPCRLPTREVRIGNLMIGGKNPVRIQTMTTPDTMDTVATVEQSIRCIKAGAELVRITAPSKKEAENLRNIRDAIRAAGYETPLVADIHFTPNAAELAAGIVEKVRINPGNYIDKKKFETHSYTDETYQAEVDRIRQRFTPLVRICKANGTAMRIGVNHGSLSDRILSRYGDTPQGMVESAMEFLRIARSEDYHQIVLSMKSSNPIVMVEAYRTLAAHMLEEFEECYPLHLGVTEAGDGEDGRIKSAVGIGTLLEEGIGDTIRVSLTEEPEYELPVCADLIKSALPQCETSKWQPVKRNAALGAQVDPLPRGLPQQPVVVADFSHQHPAPEDLQSVGYRYDKVLDKWHILDAAADFVYLGYHALEYELPGTLRGILNAEAYQKLSNRQSYVPLLALEEWREGMFTQGPVLVDVAVSRSMEASTFEALAKAATSPFTVLCLSGSGPQPASAIKALIEVLGRRQIYPPVLLRHKSTARTVDEQLIDFSIGTGSVLLDGLGNGIWLQSEAGTLKNTKISGRTYLPVSSEPQFLNNTSFSILQATRRRISKTEYISCPSCGRTLFDLQETTAKIRSATNHLKGLKIAIMGCIVNGPGEMADADFGYVGAGPGKITLYKGHEVMKRNIPSEVAVDELIQLLKDHDVWVDAPALV